MASPFNTSSQPPRLLPISYLSKQLVDHSFEGLRDLSAELSILPPSFTGGSGHVGGGGAGGAGSASSVAAQVQGTNFEAIHQRRTRLLKWVDSSLGMWVQLHQIIRASEEGLLDSTQKAQQAQERASSNQRQGQQIGTGMENRTGMVLQQLSKPQFDLQDAVATVLSGGKTAGPGLEVLEAALLPVGAQLAGGNAEDGGCKQSNLLQQYLAKQQAATEAAAGAAAAAEEEEAGGKRQAQERTHALQKGMHDGFLLRPPSVMGLLRSHAAAVLALLLSSPLAGRHGLVNAELGQVLQRGGQLIIGNTADSAAFHVSLQSDGSVRLELPGFFRASLLPWPVQRKKGGGKRKQLSGAAGAGNATVAAGAPAMSEGEEEDLSADSVGMSLLGLSLLPSSSLSGRSLLHPQVATSLSSLEAGAMKQLHNRLAAVHDLQDMQNRMSSSTINSSEVAGDVTGPMPSPAGSALASVPASSPMQLEGSPAAEVLEAVDGSNPAVASVAAAVTAETLTSQSLLSALDSAVTQLAGFVSSTAIARKPLSSAAAVSLASAVSAAGAESSPSPSPSTYLDTVQEDFVAPPKGTVKARVVRQQLSMTVSLWDFSAARLSQVQPTVPSPVFTGPAAIHNLSTAVPLKRLLEWPGIEGLPLHLAVPPEALAAALLDAAEQGSSSAADTAGVVLGDGSRQMSAVAPPSLQAVQASLAAEETFIAGAIERNSLQQQQLTLRQILAAAAVAGGAGSASPSPDAPDAATSQSSASFSSLPQAINSSLPSSRLLAAPQLFTEAGVAVTFPASLGSSGALAPSSSSSSSSSTSSSASLRGAVDGLDLKRGAGMQLLCSSSAALLLEDAQAAVGASAAAGRGATAGGTGGGGRAGGGAGGGGSLQEWGFSTREIGEAVLKLDADTVAYLQQERQREKQQQQQQQQQQQNGQSLGEGAAAAASGASSSSSRSHTASSALQASALSSWRPWAELQRARTVLAWEEDQDMSMDKGKGSFSVAELLQQWMLSTSAGSSSRRYAWARAALSHTHAAGGPASPSPYAPVSAAVGSLSSPQLPLLLHVPLLHAAEFWALSRALALSHRQAQRQQRSQQEQHGAGGAAAPAAPLLSIADLQGQLNAAASAALLASASHGSASGGGMTGPLLPQLQQELVEAHPVTSLHPLHCSTGLQPAITNLLQELSEPVPVEGERAASGSSAAIEGAAMKRESGAPSSSGGIEAEGKKQEGSEVREISVQLVQCLLRVMQQLLSLPHIAGTGQEVQQAISELILAYSEPSKVEGAPSPSPSAAAASPPALLPSPLSDPVQLSKLRGALGELVQERYSEDAAGLLSCLSSPVLAPYIHSYARQRLLAAGLAQQLLAAEKKARKSFGSTAFAHSALSPTNPAASPSITGEAADAPAASPTVKAAPALSSLLSVSDLIVSSRRAVQELLQGADTLPDFQMSDITAAAALAHILSPAVVSEGLLEELALPVSAEAQALFTSATAADILRPATLAALQQQQRQQLRSGAPSSTILSAAAINASSASAAAGILAEAGLQRLQEAPALIPPSLLTGNKQVALQGDILSASNSRDKQAAAATLLRKDILASRGSVSGGAAGGAAAGSSGAGAGGGAGGASRSGGAAGAGASSSKGRAGAAGGGGGSVGGTGAAGGGGSAVLVTIKPVLALLQGRKTVLRRVREGRKMLREALEQAGKLLEVLAELVAAVKASAHVTPVAGGAAAGVGFFDSSTPSSPSLAAVLGKARTLLQTLFSGESKHASDAAERRQAGIQRLLPSLQSWLGGSSAGRLQLPDRTLFWLSSSFSPKMLQAPSSSEAASEVPAVRPWQPLPAPNEMSSIALASQAGASAAEAILRMTHLLLQGRADSFKGGEAPQLLPLSRSSHGGKIAAWEAVLPLPSLSLSHTLSVRLTLDVLTGSPRLQISSQPPLSAQTQGEDKLLLKLQLRVRELEAALQHTLRCRLQELHKAIAAADCLTAEALQQAMRVQGIFRQETAPAEALRRKKQAVLSTTGTPTPTPSPATSIPASAPSVKDGLLGTSAAAGYGSAAEQEQHFPLFLCDAVSAGLLSPPSLVSLPPPALGIGSVAPSASAGRHGSTACAVCGEEASASAGPLCSSCSQWSALADKGSLLGTLFRAVGVGERASAGASSHPPAAAPAAVSELEALLIRFGGSADAACGDGAAEAAAGEGTGTQHGPDSPAFSAATELRQLLQQARSLSTDRQPHLLGRATLLQDGATGGAAVSGSDAAALVSSWLHSNSRPLPAADSLTCRLQWQAELVDWLRREEGSSSRIKQNCDPASLIAALLPVQHQAELLALLVCPASEDLASVADLARLLLRLNSRPAALLTFLEAALRCRSKGEAASARSLHSLLLQAASLCSVSTVSADAVLAAVQASSTLCPSSTTAGADARGSSSKGLSQEQTSLCLQGFSFSQLSLASKAAAAAAAVLADGLISASQELHLFVEAEEQHARLAGKALQGGAIVGASSGAGAAGGAGAGGVKKTRLETVSLSYSGSSMGNSSSSTQGLILPGMRSRSCIWSLRPRFWLHPEALLGCFAVTEGSAAGGSRAAAAPADELMSGRKRQRSSSGSDEETSSSLSSPAPSSLALASSRLPDLSTIVACSHAGLLEVQSLLRFACDASLPLSLPSHLITIRKAAAASLPEGKDSLQHWLLVSSPLPQTVSLELQHLQHSAVTGMKAVTGSASYQEIQLLCRVSLATGAGEEGKAAAAGEIASHKGGPLLQLLPDASPPGSAGFSSAPAGLVISDETPSEGSGRGAAGRGHMQGFCPDYMQLSLEGASVQWLPEQARQAVLGQLQPASGGEAPQSQRRSAAVQSDQSTLWLLELPAPLLSELPLLSQSSPSGPVQKVLLQLLHSALSAAQAAGAAAVAIIESSAASTSSFQAAIKQAAQQAASSVENVGWGSGGSGTAAGVAAAGAAAPPQSSRMSGLLMPLFSVQATAEACSSAAADVASVGSLRCSEPLLLLAEGATAQALRRAADASAMAARAAATGGRAGAASAGHPSLSRMAAASSGAAAAAGSSVSTAATLLFQLQLSSSLLERPESKDTSHYPLPWAAVPVALPLLCLQLSPKQAEAAGRGTGRAPEGLDRTSPFSLLQQAQGLLQDLLC